MINRISTIKYYLEKRKSVLVLGPRGTGKSYYINYLLSCFADVMKIDLLNSAIFRRYFYSPEQLIKDVSFQLQDHNELYVFIDEIQKIPHLLDDVHSLIESNKNKVIFILTGSSARKLKKDHANLLAGRALFVPFFTLNHREIDYSANLEKILQYGCLPEAFLEKDELLVQEYLQTYTHVYLKEEIMQEAVVRNIEGFGQFLELAGYENGMPVNYSKIGKQIHLSTNTIKSHYQILEDTLLVTKIPAWTYSVRKQLQQAAKYYFFDNGVLNSLIGELRTELRPSSFRYGKLFENLVINEIIKHNNLNRLDYKFYHYRTNHGVEIDLIAQKNLNAPPIAIEIKSGNKPNFIDVKNILSIREDYPEAKCYVICNTNTPYEDNSVTFLPFPEGIKDIFV